MNSSKKIFPLLFVASLLMAMSFKRNIPEESPSADKWSGKVSWIKTSKSKGKRTENNGLDLYRWDHFFEYRIDVTFKDSKGTVVRADITTNWDKDSIVFTKPDQPYLIEVETRTINCNGQQASDLEVKFDGDRKNYWISFYTPTCVEKMIYEKTSNMFTPVSNTTNMNHEGIQINLPTNLTGEPVGKTPNLLSGKWEEIIPSPNDPGGGEIITKGIWDLTKTK